VPRKGDPRINKMWEARWRDAGGVEHRRTVPSATEAATLLARQAELGGVPIGEPTELEDRWLARWRDVRGHDRKRPFTSYGAAKRHLVAEDGKRARNEYHDPRGGRRLFGEYAAEVAATRADRRASTLARDESMMRSLVLPAFADMRLAAISEESVQAFVSSLVGRRYDPWTVRKAYQLLAGVMARAVRARHIPRTPCDGIDLPKIEHDQEQRFLSAAEVGQLADAIDPRYWALVLTAAYTGCRFGELAALRVKRIDFLRRQVRIEETLNEVRGQIVTGPPKTRKARRAVSIPSFLADVLSAHVAGKPADGYVFSAPEGGPLRRNGFRRRFWQPAVRASVGEPLRFHDLRHSHAALLIAEGVHPKAMADRLGHSSIRTTLDVYGHLLEGLDGAAADALDVMFRNVPTTPAVAGVVQIGGGA
jgi:integrase